METEPFDQLEKLHAKHKDWLFGYLSYDLKNKIEKLSSKNQAKIEFDDIMFFQPELVFIIRDMNHLEVQYPDFWS
ncbi:MAG: hypothetical protein C0594_13505, partial [Marinilabiliales bacterium]